MIMNPYKSNALSPLTVEEVKTWKSLDLQSCLGAEDAISFKAPPGTFALVNDCDSVQMIGTVNNEGDHYVLSVTMADDYNSYVIRLELFVIDSVTEVSCTPVASYEPGPNGNGAICDPILYYKPNNS